MALVPRVICEFLGRRKCCVLQHGDVDRAPLFPLCSPGVGAGGSIAKDALGNDVKASEWLKSHKKGDRSLTQGLKVGCCQQGRPE